METAREVNKNLPGRAEQGGTQIPLHKPKVKRGPMGLIVSPFQGAKRFAQDAPGCVVQQESFASFGSAYSIKAATPR